MSTGLAQVAAEPDDLEDPLGGAAEVGGINDDLTPLLRSLADRANPPAVELICDHHTHPVQASSGTLVVRLDGCASELSSASYLEVATAGVAGLTVRTECCPHADRVEAAVAAANRLLAACPQTPTVVCRADHARGRHRRVYDLHKLPISRRRLLLLVLPASRSLPHVRGDERARTVAALRTLRGDGAAPSSLQELPAPSADLVAHKCTACGVCVRACPTSALELRRALPDGAAGALPDGAAGALPDGAAGFSLVLSPARCVDCGRCTALCPEGSLVRGGPLDWGRVIDDTARCVATGSARSCARCGASVAATGPGGYCPVCEFRTANPFGSWLPGRPTVTPAEP